MTESFDDAWDRLCIDPFQSAFEEGRAQGKDDGERAGFREGYKLGSVTAIEYGMEIGFARGVINAIEKLNCDTEDDRIRQSVQKLRTAIDDFPGPEQIFQKEKHASNQINTDSEQEINEMDEEGVDVEGKMQRIRARLKLLTVQLGMPRLSLKSVMDDAGHDSRNDASTSTTSNLPVPPNESEW